MTQVIFDVVDLAGEVHPGDTVSVWPPYVTSTVDGRVMSTRRIDVLVDEGPVTEDIDPGPMVVQLQCRGIADTKPRTVTIPDEGTVTLANLLQSTFTYTPAVVSQVSLDAQRAEDAAVRAEANASAVQSVNGQSGAVVLGHADVGAAPASHTHPATSISDATTVGRAVLTAADAATARTAIGAGTSSLALGTTSSTAKAGNYQPTAANISDATTVGRNVLKASDAAAARTAIGAVTAGDTSAAINNALAPDGNHGGLIMDSQLLGSGDAVFNFPSKVSGQVTVRVTGRSPVTGNQALVGYMFRGPNGEKALEGMSGLSYSAAVGEPYRYLGVQAPNVGFTDSITVTPAPGWTLDGIVIRAWNEGAGNVLVTGVFVDTGLGPKVVTRDLNGGISVPLVPTSNASAAARGYVTARTPQIIVASSLPGTPISAAVYVVTGTNPGVYVGSTKIAGL